ncbi:MAG: xylulokinase [Lachnospiraceae bacterium]|nr:xylulokinase [Lachnospiraceae bacterium]
MAYLMGVDLGTSSLKTIIIEESGEVKAICVRDYQFLSPINGYAEHNPEEWWQACCATIQEALKKSGIKAEDIKGISFSGQMHGAVMLDKNYQIVRPAILHCDARSSDQVEFIKQSFGEQKIKELVMNPIYTGFLLPSLLWVRDHEPINYERIRYVCLPKDYLKFKMTGEMSSDFSDASATLAFDIRNNCWSKEILNKLDIAMELFPYCYNTDQAAGTVSLEASKATMLSTTTIVVAGGGDQVMQGIGNGITQVGGASVNIGTSGQVSFQSDRAILNPKLSTNTFCGYQKGRWITMGAIMNAGLSLKWCNELLQQNDYKMINEIVEQVKPGSGGVVFLPYLNGERTPHLNPNISGEFVGLNLNTGRAELTRAVMEGVAYALMQCIEVCGDLGLKAESLVASGGGARSLPWLQMQADIYNIPLKVAKTQEQAGLGAAIAAGVGSGVYRNIQEGCQTVVKYQDMVMMPNQKNHETYQAYYQLYKDIYIASKDVLQRVTLAGRNA